MIILIRQNNKVVGRYDHRTQTMTSSDEFLNAIPHQGARLLTGKTTESGAQITRVIKVMPHDERFLDALADMLMRMGYDVDEADEYASDTSL